MEGGIMLLYIGAFVFASINSATCDYKCLCNYNTEKTIYRTPSTSGNILGYMYEFDCKSVSGPSGIDGWLMIAFEHELGYLDNDSQLQIQTCPGSIPDEDKVLSIPTTLTHRTIYNSNPTVKTEAGTWTSNATRILTSPTLSSTEITTQYKPNLTVASMGNVSLTVSVATSMTSPITNASVSTEENVLNSTTTETSVQFTSTRTNMSTKATITQNKTTSSIPVAAASNTYVTTDALINTTFPVTRMQTTVMTTTPSVEGRIQLCPISVQLEANGYDGTILAQFGDKCYEIVQTKVSWSHAEKICQTNKGHLVDIASQQEQDFLFDFLANIQSHTVWLGLHDRNAEENFVWTSGSQVTFTNWKIDRKNRLNHQTQDCVYMTGNGSWDDINCGSDDLSTEYQKGFLHAYICQYATVNPQDGEVNKCPHILQIRAEKDNGILSQYGDSCYELVPNVSIAWQHAEDVCHSRGGHLAYIKSAEEQSFVLGFMRRHSPNHSVWIGLTDLGSEGHFHWTSGESARYANWIPQHTNNEKENCVVFMPHNNGQWDDIGCGSSHHYASGITDAGENHPILCQYRSVSGAPVIG